jgi:hypothetical protein
MNEHQDPFEEDKQRRARLYRQMRTVPSSHVIGLVGPAGAFCRQSQGEDWEAGICFAAWRIEGREVQERELVVRQYMPREEADRIWRSVLEYSILRVRARIVTETEFEKPQGLLEQVIGRGEDEELRGIGVALRVPVVHEDPDLGPLTLDRRLARFSGTATWSGGDVEVSFDAESADELETLLTVGRQVWADQRDWAHRVADFAATALLGIKNGHWLGEEEEPLSAERFVSFLRLQSIAVHRDGRIEFWHDDGDLFWGHSVRVTCDLRRGPFEAEIEG